MNTFDKIYNLVSEIPNGKVMTYGQIAKSLNIRNSRIVGFALHVNKNPNKVPCHRVVYSDGRLAKGFAFGGESAQEEKLKNEGIFFEKPGVVDLSKNLWL